MVKIGELMMILELHRQGLSVAAIARETGKDAKTIRRYIGRGLEPPVYGPRPPARRAFLAALGGSNTRWLSRTRTNAAGEH